MQSIITVESLLCGGQKWIVVLKNVDHVMETQINCVMTVLGVK